MPRCEKCGYPRAFIEWCTSCGSKDPYPKRKWFLRGLLIASLLAILIAGTLFARRAASDRIAKTKAETGSFRVERPATLLTPTATRR